jgi:dATP pyrophosphohydrolase
MAQRFSTVAVINRDKKILLLKRGPTAPYNPNNYCFPGGNVEENESLEDAASRELYEETGIVVDNNSLEKMVIVYPSGYKKIIFVTKIHDAEVTLNYEHINYAWVTSNDSINYPMVNGLRITLSSLHENGLIV